MRIASCLVLALVCAGCTVARVPTQTDLCSQIEYISDFPVKRGLPSDDEVYSGLIEAGLKSLPCLRGRVGDNTLMKYPSSMPGVETVAVGDLAFFIWWRISGAGFDEIFPEDVVAKYNSEGIYAYFSYVGVPGNRARLVKRLGEWEATHLDSRPQSPRH